MNAKQRITVALAIAASFVTAGAYAQAGSPTAQQATAPAATAVSAQATQATTAVAAVAAARPAATGLTRAQVIAELLEARKNGTIPETEADFDVAQTRKHYAK